MMKSHGIIQGEGVRMTKMSHFPQEMPEIQMKN